MKILNKINSSIKSKIMVIPVSIIMAIGIIVSVYFPQNKSVELKRTLAEEIDITADLLSYGFGVALEAGDFGAIKQVYEIIKNKEQISYIIILDEKNELLNAYNPKNYKIDSTRTIIDTLIIINKDFIEKSSKIRTAKSSYGTVIVGISLDPLKKTISGIIIGTIVISLIFLIVAVLFTTLLVQRIIQPLQVIAKIVTALGNGDLTQKCVVHSTDETSRIAAAVNQTISSLTGMIIKMKEYSNTIAEESNQFSQMADSIIKNTEIVTSKSTESANSATEAKENLSSISIAADNMSDSVNSVATSIEEMSSTINEIASNCQNELVISTKANEQAHSAFSQMERLKNASSEIRKVLDIISSIANKINLLALNATIEAANAGEAGRGFSVVAREVKELAKQTSVSATQIHKQIEEMAISSDISIKTVQNISEVIEEINSISQTIANSVEEQSATVQEISKKMTESNTAANAIAKNVTSSAGRIAEITGLVVDVDRNAHETEERISVIKNSTESLVKIANGLSELITKFKV